MTDTKDELVNVRVHLAGKETDANTESEQIIWTPIKQSFLSI